jgi:hypothetical protein
MMARILEESSDFPTVSKSAAHKILLSAKQTEPCHDWPDRGITAWVNLAMSFANSLAASMPWGPKKLRDNQGNCLDYRKPRLGPTVICRKDPF